jgi:hypothetical protein
MGFDPGGIANGASHRAGKRGVVACGSGLTRADPSPLKTTPRSSLRYDKKF